MENFTKAMNYQIQIYINLYCTAIMTASLGL